MSRYGTETGQLFKHGIIPQWYRVVWSMSDSWPENAKKKPHNYHQTSDKTEAILFYLRDGKLSRRQIARLFNVSPSWVQQVWEREISNLARQA